MSRDIALLAHTKDAISMHGFLVLHEIESHHHEGADGSRILTGTLRVSSSSNPAEPLLYVGFSIEHRMVSLTCSPRGQSTRTWSLSSGDTLAWRALMAELRLIYDDLLPQSERPLMASHVTGTSHQQME